MFFNVKENWLTKSPDPAGAMATLIMAFLMCAGSFIYFRNILGAEKWMPAVGDLVFKKHEYWRLWSALFAHSDMSHLLSNMLLFIPLTYWLAGYFGYLVFPVLGVFLGGAVNFFALKTMPLQSSIVGVSGVVYWMGAAWVTLFLLIDRRYELKRRFATALFLCVVLLAPETYKPEISYMSHLLGFLMGIPCALLIYYLRRDQYFAAEVREYTAESDPLESPERV
jgi:rhomboid protease GluP